MKFKEIETKYSADTVSLKSYREFCASLNPTSIKNLSSYDHYFLKSKNKFIRYRAGNRPELTTKQKTKADNNYVRVEVNLHLSTKVPPRRRLRTVEALCAALGYRHNFTIFKTCYIYYYKNFNLVYYIVYDRNKRELARFLEIEMSEEYPWASEAAAWRKLLKIETKMKALGISSKDRISQSLFEMFRKV